MILPSFSLIKKASSLLLLLLLVLILEQHSSVVLGYTRDDFPPDFVFGSGTSAYQVEGAVSEDGKTPSVLDIRHDFPGADGDTGQVACDEYHKYKEDVQLMVDTGLEAYRFSISWTRIISNGTGPVNPKGIEHYNNLINELINNGIQPHVTLMHFDYPLFLQDAYGGFLDRQIVKDFTTYAEVCFKEFGDRVLHWTTINEPTILATKTYATSSQWYVAGHNILLAHASAANLYNQKFKAKQHGTIGLSLYTSWYIPETNSESDLIAMKRVRDFETGWFIHPLVYGDYPDTMKQALGSILPSFTEHESKLVKGAFDFIGVLCYNATIVKDDPHGEIDICMQAKCCLSNASVANNMKEALEYIRHAYGNFPIYILENGYRTLQKASLQDTSRVAYLNATIGGLLDALRNGPNVRGYFQWSFLDLFEFYGGYKTGYGLYYVDFDDVDLRRYPKLSAHWYSTFLKGETFDSHGIIQQINNYSLCQSFSICNT